MMRDFNEKTHYIIKGRKLKNNEIWNTSSLDVLGLTSSLINNEIVGYQHLHFLNATDTNAFRYFIDTYE